MTLEQITTALETGRTLWFGKLGVCVYSTGVRVYRSRKEIFRGSVAEAADFIFGKVYAPASTAQRERQTTRSGGKYKAYELRCEFCNTGIGYQSYDTVEFEEDGQPYPACSSCYKKHLEGKLSA